jgi:triacylglycerol esterase/lipase EstA (alpha/beta hydrolase family)
MFANLVRLSLLAELAAWFAIGAWARGAFGWSVAAVAAIAVFGSPAIRLALVCVSLLLSWSSRSPRSAAHRLGAGGSVALVLGEWRAMLTNNYLWLPFERVVLRPDPPLVRGGRMPVIVVHGYFSNRGTVCALARALDAAGVAPVFVPSLPAIVAPIAEFAAHLERVVREVTQATGQPRVVLVCHSMGGLIARAYLASCGAGGVSRLVTIGSPHHGTTLASLGAGSNARQMRIGSEFLRELEAREGGSGPGCGALSVYTVHDNLVSPQDTSRLAWARNVEIHGVGHLAMLQDERVHRAVLEELAAAGAAAGG